MDKKIQDQNGGITWQLIEQTLATSGMLEAVIDGRAKDDGPCCGSVPLINNGWTVSAKEKGRGRKSFK